MEFTPAGPTPGPGLRRAPGTEPTVIAMPEPTQASFLKLFNAMNIY